MRHRNTQSKFNTHGSGRRALKKNLMRSFFLHGSVRTTETRAKAIKPDIEHLITISKKNDVTARRMIIQKTGSRIAANRLLSDIAPKYAERRGGYTRITKIGNRPGDNARTVLLSLV